ncbi:MAG: AroM family protein [Bacillota bacterium]
MKLGTLTIGQSPRADMLPEMVPLFGPGVAVVERGALDGLSLDEVKAFAPTTGDYVLVTRMGDGTSVTIAERFILPRMKQHVADLAAEGCDAVLLLCTGEFPSFTAPVPLVRPVRLLKGVVGALAKDGHLGVLTPSAEQVPQATKRWLEVAPRVTAQPASPYGAPGLVDAGAMGLAAAGVELVLMDCMGYTQEMKARVKAIVKCPVLLARGVVARVVGELVS